MDHEKILLTNERTDHWRKLLQNTLTFGPGENEAILLNDLSEKKKPKNKERIDRQKFPLILITHIPFASRVHSSGSCRIIYSSRADLHTTLKQKCNNHIHTINLNPLVWSRTSLFLRYWLMIIEITWNTILSLKLTHFFFFFKRCIDTLTASQKNMGRAARSGNMLNEHSAAELPTVLSAVILPSFLVSTVPCQQLLNSNNNKSKGS